MIISNVIFGTNISRIMILIIQTLKAIKEVFTFHESLFDTKSCNIYRVFVISRCEHTRESIAHANRVSLIHRGTLHAYFFFLYTDHFFQHPFLFTITHFRELFSATHGSTRRFRALHSENFLTLSPGKIRRIAPHVLFIVFPLCLF